MAELYWLTKSVLCDSIWAREASVQPLVGGAPSASNRPNSTLAAEAKAREAARRAKAARMVIGGSLAD